MSQTSRALRPVRWAVVPVLPLVAALSLPSAALAASSGTDVRVHVGDDGSVKKTVAYAADGSEADFDGKLPITLSIKRSAKDGQRTFRYHVENTTTKAQEVTYTAADGTQTTEQVDVQLPLVAQLSVTVPDGAEVTKATGALVTATADGGTRVVWQLVLFGPLGLPAQDVRLTIKGTDDVTTRLEATTVDAEGQPGATALGQSSAKDYGWHGLARTGDAGLAQLAGGVGQLVDGLAQLADGTHKLSDGLGEAVGGIQKIDGGTQKVADGTGQLSDGMGKLADGQTKLAGGLGQLATGQSALTDGMRKIHGGLTQFTDPVKGVPAAVGGLQQINAGMAALEKGLGDEATAGTLINGAAKIRDGIGALRTAVSGQIAPALGCASTVLTLVANGAGAAAGTANPCFGTSPVPPLPGVDPMSKAVLTSWAKTLGDLQTALSTQVAGGLQQLEAGQAAIVRGLSHTPTGEADKGGIKEGVAQMSGGLSQVVTGLGAAMAGLTQLTDGTGKLADGSGKLGAGLTAAADGSKQLADGGVKAYDGSKKLADGVRQLADGQHKLATGMPATVTGSAKLADGLDQVVDGTTQLQDGIGRLGGATVTQLEAVIGDDKNAVDRDLATVRAASARAADAPGGAGSSYVFADDLGEIELVSSSDGDTVKYGGLGLGALGLVIVAVASGFALGRRRSTAG